MIVVLDTNVLVSGIFFSGPPSTILDHWYDGHIDIAISISILDEYRRVARILASKHPTLDIEPILDIVTVNSLLYDPLPLTEQVCTDADDDKFIECALASGADYLVSGDKHLLAADGFRALEIVRPRFFVDECM